MPRRPLPEIPRGPRRLRPALGRLVLGCPRLSPDWELAALKALVKPQLGDRIRHRSGEQAWPDDGPRRVFDAAREVARRLGFAPLIHLPESGDYHFIAEIDRSELDPAKALALVLSARLPGVWLVLGRLLIRDGRFYVRQRPRGLALARAAHVHIRRDLRAEIRDLLRPAGEGNGRRCHDHPPADPAPRADSLPKPPRGHDR